MNPQRYLLCIQNRGYRASLEPRKVYQQLPDLLGEKHDLVRVVDESGEDYLYPSAFFVSIKIPPQAARAFRKRSA